MLANETAERLVVYVIRLVGHCVHSSGFFFSRPAVHGEQQVQIRSARILSFQPPPAHGFEHVRSHPLAIQHLVEVELLLVDGTNQIHVIVRAREQASPLLRVNQHPVLLLFRNQLLSREYVAETRLPLRRSRTGGGGRPREKRNLQQMETNGQRESGILPHGKIDRNGRGTDLTIPLETNGQRPTIH